MFRRIIVPFILLSAVCGAPGRALAEPPAPSQEKVKKLSLKELWQLTERRYPGLVAARHAETAAKHTLDEQKWLRLPSGEVTTYLSWSPDIKCQNPQQLGLSVMGQQVMNAQGQPIGGPQSCVSTTASLSLLEDDIRRYLPIHGVLFRMDARLVQPLFTFGKLRAATDLGQVGLELAKAGTEINRADLALNLLRAYYGLKTARAALDTITEGKDQIVAWIKRIDEDLEKGRQGYSEIDLMRLKVADSQVEIVVVDVDRTVKSTLKALRFLGQDEQLDVDEGELALAAEETRDVSHYLDAAILRRPEMRQIRALGEGARSMHRLRVAELLPDFALVANIGYGVATSVEDPGHAFMNRFNYLGAGLGLVMRWGLDFGPRVARLFRARADLAQYQARQREALGGIALEIERTFNDLVEARKRLKAAETGERRARGWLQGIQQAIDVGTAESRDMIDALRSYFDQHLLVLRTINNVNVLSATLRRQCGMDVIKE